MILKQYLSAVITQAVANYPCRVGWLDVLAAVAGPIVSGVLGKQAYDADMEAYGSRIQTTVADAKAAGIHPLEAIRSGAAGALPPTQPNLLTAASAQNMFDGIADVLTGRQALEDADKEVQRDINRITRDQMKMESDALSKLVGNGAGLKAEAPKQTPINTIAGKETTNKESEKKHPLDLAGEVPEAENSNEPIIKRYTFPDGTSGHAIEDWGVAAQLGAQWLIGKTFTTGSKNTREDNELVRQRLVDQGYEGADLKNLFQSITNERYDDVFSN